MARLGAGAARFDAGQIEQTPTAAQGRGERFCQNQNRSNQPVDAVKGVCGNVERTQHFSSRTQEITSKVFVTVRQSEFVGRKADAFRE